MATTAETYGFGARAPYAAPRASEHDMKERARLSGLLPRMNDKPLSKTLNGLVKEFEQNAALGAILERRRALEGLSQYLLQGQEAMDNVNRNLAPWARAGRAIEATSAQVAQRVARPAPPPDAADVMTGNNLRSGEKAGTYSVGGSESTRATGVGATEPSEFGTSTWFVGSQGNPQTTLTGELGKSRRRQIQQTRPLVGNGALSNSLVTEWRARSSG